MSDKEKEEALSPDQNPVQSSVTEATPPKVVIEVDDMNFSYIKGKEVLRDISMEINKGEVTAFIGPSGCGKSTLLRCLNRMNDLIPTAEITKGNIRILGTDIHGRVMR